MARTPSAKFTQLFDKVNDLQKSGDSKVAPPSDDEKLNLYGWAKIAKGEDIESSPKPGMFDLKRKAMRGRWQKQLDEGTTPEQAEQKYIELGEKIVARYS